MALAFDARRETCEHRPYPIGLNSELPLFFPVLLDQSMRSGMNPAWSIDWQEDRTIHA